MRKQLRSFLGLLLSVMMVFSTVNLPVLALEDCTHTGSDLSFYGDIVWTSRTETTHTGERSVSCNVCKRIVSENIIDVDAENHTFDGNKCSVCGYVKADITPGVTPTVSPTPSTTPAVSPSPTVSPTPSTTPTPTCAHEHKTYDRVDDYKHKVHCADCNQDLEDEVHSGGTKAGEVNYNGKSGCMEPGKVIYSECDKCGALEYLKEVEAKTAHTGKEGEKCSVCDKTLLSFEFYDFSGKVIKSELLIVGQRILPPDYPTDYPAGTDTKNGKQAWKHTYVAGGTTKESKMLHSAFYEKHDPNPEGVYAAEKTNKFYPYYEAAEVTPTPTVTPCPDSEHKKKDNYKYVSAGTKKHDIVCNICGTTIKSNVSCTFKVDKEDYDDVEDFDPKYHSQTCKYCYNSREVKHSFGYNYNDNDKHIITCACGYKDEQSCNYSNDKCTECGHSKSSSSSSSSSSGSSTSTANTAPTDLESLRQSGKALAKNVLTLKMNGATYDVSAIEGTFYDMVNQYYIGNVLLTQLGYNLLTPTKTYKFSSYAYYLNAGQAVTLTWTNTGLKAGDTAYVVYWHPVKKIQLLPCIVGMDGSATFSVPDINGSICTLVKCEKIAPPTTKKGKK